MKLIEIRLARLNAGALRGTDEQLAELAESIKTLGLLQPVVIDSKRRVIAGRRRIHALKRLGLSHARAVQCDNLDDALKAVKAERDENTCRLQYTRSEQVEIADRILAAERPKAEAREKAGKKTVDEPCAKFAQGSSNDNQRTQEASGRAQTAKEKAAAGAGMSRPTYEKAKAVTEAAAADPERYGDLRDQMDDSGKVDSAHKEMIRRQEEDTKKEQSPTERMAELAAEFCREINQHTRAIDNLLQTFEVYRTTAFAHDIHWPTVAAQLVAVRKALHQGRPKRTCPYCKGTGKDRGECKPCKGCGHVCEAKYKAGCAAVGIPEEKGADE